MKTLSQYLQDIAVAVLEPLGYLYAVQGTTEGVWGYAGIHTTLDTSEWIKIATIELPQYIGPADKLSVGQQPITTMVPIYDLWYAQVDSRQASWWKKREL